MVGQDEQREGVASMANKDVASMVRGLGLGARLITDLIRTVEGCGGKTEMLHHLTTAAGADNLAKVGALIASLPWCVPKSLVMKMARDFAIEEGAPERADEWEFFFWEPALQKLEIPYIRFIILDEMDDGCHDVASLGPVLDGRTMSSGMRVEWRDEMYIVTSVGVHDERGAFTGRVINVADLYFVHLTPLGHIDMNA